MKYTYTPWTSGLDDVRVPLSILRRFGPKLDTQSSGTRVDNVIFYTTRTVGRRPSTLVVVHMNRETMENVKLC